MASKGCEGRGLVLAAACLACGAASCLPTATAAGVSYVDQDPTQGITSGTVLVRRAADESTIGEYDLYWGSTPRTKLPGAPRIAALPKTGADITYAIPSGTAVPPGATSFVVFTANAAGELPFGIGTLPVDNYAHHADASAGGPAGSGLEPSATFDPGRGQLWVATRVGPNFDGPALTRCEGDGIGCVRTEIDAGQPPASGDFPSAVFDTADDAVIVTTTLNEDGVDKGDLGYFRCPPTATGCTYADLGPAGVTPAVGIDPNGELQIAARALDAIDTYSCNRDGTGCSQTGVGLGFGPSLAFGRFDTGWAFVGVWRQQLPENVYQLGVYSCALPGFSPCSFQNGSIAAPGSDYDQNVANAVVAEDDTGPLLLLLGYYDGGPTLYYVDAGELAHAGTSSFAAVPLPAAAGMSPPFSMLLDETNQKLLIVGDRGDDLGLVRCEIDGTGCSYASLLNGQPPRSGTRPSAVIDVARQRLLVAADDAANGDRLGVFWIGLW